MKKFLGIFSTYFWSTERSHFNTRSYGENRAVRIPCVGTVHLSMLAEDAGGWSHWDQIALGADNGTSNNKIEGRLG